jgi:hypothetical protein
MGVPWSHIRTWENEWLEDSDKIDQLIRNIGWVVGTDSDGRTLYHYSKEECREMLKEAGVI